jgi:hypothetical protein
MGSTTMTLEQIRDKFQEYLDESGTESDEFIVGMDVTRPGAIELLNDILLYMAGGDRTKVKPLTD